MRQKQQQLTDLEKERQHQARLRRLEEKKVELAYFQDERDKRTAWGGPWNFDRVNAKIGTLNTEIAQIEADLDPLAKNSAA